MQSLHFNSVLSYEVCVLFVCFVLNGKASYPNSGLYREALQRYRICRKFNKVCRPEGQYRLYRRRNAYDIGGRDLTRILEAVEKNIDLSGVREFTVEAGRPDTITEDKLRTLKCGGVSRISINPQTTNNEILHKIGRLHTAEDFLRAYEMADRIGFSCINTDLIAGLPGESADSFRRSFDTILELEPENITVHTFCVKKAADFAEQKSLYSRSDKDTGESISYSQKRSAQADYIPYYMYKQKNAVGAMKTCWFPKKV